MCSAIDLAVVRWHLEVAGFLAQGKDLGGPLDGQPASPLALVAATAAAAEPAEQAAETAPALLLFAAVRFRRVILFALGFALRFVLRAGAERPAEVGGHADAGHLGHL